MQNLYMMTALIREQQMRKMAIEIIQGLINMEDAMQHYNVATREAVISRVEALKAEKQPYEKHQPEEVGLSVLAA